MFESGYSHGAKASWIPDVLLPVKMEVRLKQINSVGMSPVVMAGATVSLDSQS